VRKATAIVQQALSSGSVLFSFPRRLFGDRVDAYKVIQEQVGANVQFRPISTWRENAGGDLLVDATKAVSNGVTVNGVVYKAVSTCSGSGVSVGGNLTHVQFIMLNAISLLGWSFATFSGLAGDSPWWCFLWCVSSFVATNSDGAFVQER
jgi:hypothetical protein